MKVLVIWLLCSAPLILTVIESVKSASVSASSEAASSTPSAGPSAEFPAADGIDESLITALEEYPWFDQPTAGVTAVSGRARGIPELKQLEQASGKLLSVNKGLREIVKALENPKDLSNERLLQDFIDTGGSLKDLRDQPLGASLARCVDTFLKQHRAEAKKNDLRDVAAANYEKARKDLTSESLTRLLDSFGKLAPEDLSEEEKERLRWGKFWRYWIQGEAKGRTMVDKAAREQVLRNLLLQSEEPDYVPVKRDEIDRVESYRREIETLAKEIKFDSIKGRIQVESLESWLADAEELINQLNDAEAKELARLIRDAVLKKVGSSQIPAISFQEAVTKGGDLWMGSFELADPNAPKKRYKFVSVTGHKEDYAYLTLFSETAREPFAADAFRRVNEARSRVQLAPHKKDSWETLQQEVVRLQQEKDKYLKLNMPPEKADRKLVSKTVSMLNLESIQSVCDEILSEEMWPRIEKILGGKR